MPDPTVRVCEKLLNVCQCSKVGLTLLSLRSYWQPTKSKICLGSSSDFSMFTPNLIPDTELLRSGNAGGKLGGTWL